MSSNALDKQPVTIKVEPDVFTGRWMYSIELVSGGRVIAPARAKLRHRAAHEAVEHLRTLERPDASVGA